MNFIELCQKVATDSGTVAGVPSFTTVAGASARTAQVVSWVQDAWRSIQNERNDWLWMKKRASAPLVINQTEYTGLQLGLSDFRQMSRDTPGYPNISLYDNALGQSDEGSIRQADYREWRERYDRGVHDANRVIEWAMTPDMTFGVGPKPDKAYIIRFEYRTKPSELALDADTPEMPEEFHLLIVAEAFRLMSISDEAFQVLLPVAQQYARLRNPLVNSQTPDMQFGGGSLA